MSLDCMAWMGLSGRVRPRRVRKNKKGDFLCGVDWIWGEKVKVKVKVKK